MVGEEGGVWWWKMRRGRSVVVGEDGGVWWWEKTEECGDGRRGRSVVMG